MESKKYIPLMKKWIEEIKKKNLALEDLQNVMSYLVKYSKAKTDRSFAYPTEYPKKLYWSTIPYSRRYQSFVKTYPTLTQAILKDFERTNKYHSEYQALQKNIHNRKKNIEAKQEARRLYRYLVLLRPTNHHTLAL